MLNIGKMNTLKIAEVIGNKCYLDGGEEGDIFIPKKEIPAGSKEGDTIEVFVYSEKNGLAATKKKPFVFVNEFAFLSVNAVTEFGIFLDWGLDKDLYMPNRFFENTDHRNSYNDNQDTPSVGNKLIVYLIPDKNTQGIIATTEVEKYLENETGELEAGDVVDLLVYKFSDLGANVIINNRYHGILYYNEIFTPLKAGDRTIGFIKKIRTDGLVDAALQRQGFLDSNLDTEDIILDILKKNRGFIPLHDKSSPEDIKKLLKISKKNFKKAVGTLYRKRIITLEENGIRLSEIL